MVGVRAAVVGAASAGALVWGAVLVAAARTRPLSPSAAAPVPPPGLPGARIVAVPDVGEMFLRDSDPDGDPARPVIVLLHGWMFPADTNWFTCYAAMAERGRVLAPDHRGHGRGLRPARPFRLVDVADDVAALLAALGAPPAVVVGYSMGGPVAQLLWQRHPEAVAGLVLCATSATFNVTARDRLTWRGVGLLQLALRLVPRDWWERGLRERTSPMGRARRRRTRDGIEDQVAPFLPWLLSELDRGSAEDVAEAGRELSRHDARGWIGTVDVPTAVVVTTADELVPPRNQRDLAARLPGAVVIEVALDHDGVIAAPEVFVPALAAAVDAVLERVRSPLLT